MAATQKKTGGRTASSSSNICLLQRYMLKRNSGKSSSTVQRYLPLEIQKLPKTSPPCPSAYWSTSRSLYAWILTGASQAGLSFLSAGFPCPLPSPCLPAVPSACGALPFKREYARLISWARRWRRPWRSSSSCRSPASGCTLRISSRYLFFMASCPASGETPRILQASCSVIPLSLYPFARICGPIFYCSNSTSW